MGLDFVAVDVETANAFRGSVCQVGLVKVSGGRIVEEWQALMQPPQGHCWVDYERGQVHGFTTRFLLEQPVFAEVWPEVLRRIGAHTLVAHNAAFDVSALTEASRAAGFIAPEAEYLCTLVLARRHLDLPTYGLDVVARDCGVPLERHHDALCDAKAAAQVALVLAARVGARNLDDLVAASGIRLGYEGGQRRQSCQALSSTPVRNLESEPRLF